MWPAGNERGFLITTRRQFLIGISAALVSSPAIVRAGSLMQVRGIVMPIHQNYYGWCDRLAINLRYHSGELRGSALIRLIDEGLLKHISPAILAYDLARWGTAQLSATAREERRRILWPPVKRLDLVRLTASTTPQTVSPPRAYKAPCAADRGVQDSPASSAGRRLRWRDNSHKNGAACGDARVRGWPSCPLL